MYKCNICNYETSRKSNFNLHNKTKKHIINKEQDNKKIKDETEYKENEILKLKENEIIKESKIEELKQKLLVSEAEKSALLKYIDLLLQNKNNSKIRKYKKKCKIPAVIRNSLWKKYFNESNVGKCCSCKLENISSANFDCGHIISEHNGGLVTLNNLKPICRLCNSSMSTMNMDEFIKKYELDCIPVINK